VCAIVVVVWTLWFMQSGLKETQSSDQADAYSQASTALAKLPNEDLRYIITHTSGSSNSWLGDDKRGYFILDTEFPFENIKPNMFVVIDLGTGVYALHRYRGDGFVEGDGNKYPDPVRLTKNNFIGVAYDKKVWRY